MSDKNGFFGLATYAGLREKIADLGIKGALNSARVCTYRGVELLFIGSECADIMAGAKEIREALSESGTEMACISCYLDVVSKSEPYRRDERSIEYVKRCIDLAEKIGSPYVHHTLVTRLSGGRENYREVLPEVVAAAGEIADYARAKGVTVLYEPQGMLFNGLDGYSGFLDEALKRHDNVGVCLDVGNTLWVDEDCYALAEKYAHQVKHVHLKDYVLDGNDERYRTMSGRTIKEVALGSGIIDLNRDRKSTRLNSSHVT